MSKGLQKKIKMGRNGKSECFSSAIQRSEQELRTSCFQRLRHKSFIAYSSTPLFVFLPPPPPHVILIGHSNLLNFEVTCSCSSPFLHHLGSTFDLHCISILCSACYDPHPSPVDNDLQPVYHPFFFFYCNRCRRWRSGRDDQWRKHGAANDDWRKDGAVGGERRKNGGADVGDVHGGVDFRPLQQMRKNTNKREREGNQCHQRERVVL